MFTLDSLDPTVWSWGIREWIQCSSMPLGARALKPLWHTGTACCLWVDITQLYDTVNDVKPMPEDTLDDEAEDDNSRSLNRFRALSTSLMTVRATTNQQNQMAPPEANPADYIQTLTFEAVCMACQLSIITHSTLRYTTYFDFRRISSHYPGFVPMRMT